MDLNKLQPKALSAGFRAVNAAIRKPGPNTSLSKRTERPYLIGRIWPQKKSLVFRGRAAAAQIRSGLRKG